MIFKILKKFALLAFDIVDIYYHQVRIKNFLKKKKIPLNTFFDVGSHLGSYTDIIMKLNPQSNCFLFEPQIRIFEKVKNKYIQLNNIKVYNLGISDTENIKNLFINMHDLTSTFSSFNEKSKYLNFKAKLYETSIDKMNYKTEQVNTITLNKFILTNKIKSIDLIKIDTEGHDLKVLYGLEKEIDIVKNILIEFHHRDLFLDYKPYEIHDFLIKNGFELIKIFKFPFSWQDRFYSKKN